MSQEFDGGKPRTDEEWEEAVADVARAGEHYQDVDFGALAEEVAHTHAHDQAVTDDDRSKAGPAAPVDTALNHLLWIVPLLATLIYVVLVLAGVIDFPRDY